MKLMSDITSLFLDEDSEKVGIFINLICGRRVK
jgi:hypothetical protein